ncbi:MAG: response regulator [Actinobacteria bacterium]|nr:response regulator [Actinomycetota bacterium]
MKRIRAVIADDDASMRELVRETLSREGAVVVAQAADGLAAVELSLEHRPDVAVLDIQMPELGGDTAAQVLRTLDPGIGLVLLSSDPSAAAPEALSSVDAVLSKLEMARLGHAVRDVVTSDERCGSIRIA